MDFNMDKEILIRGRLKDLGGFSVMRILPHAKKRTVGPFVFLDHLGPMMIDSSHYLNVRPHPHIGLATVTYLFEGRIRHRDSLGSDQVIYPGDLNWMTAGKGIVHSEQTLDEDRNLQSGQAIHGIQIWVALPLEYEECKPDFTHYSKDNLPELELSQGLSGHLLIGSHLNIHSPVVTYSPTLLLDLKATKNAEDQLSFMTQELGIFLISGECTINGQALNVNDLIVVSDPATVRLNYTKQTRLIIIGGSPLPEPRFVWWNFVSSSKDRIRKAATDWQNHAIGHVFGELDEIPLPNLPFPS